MPIFGAVNVAMFDWPWSTIHLMSGTLIGLLATWWIVTRPRKVFWWAGYGLLTLWEIYERTLHFLDVHHHQAIAGFKATVMNFAFAPETKLNTFGDLVIGGAGLFLGRYIIIKIKRGLEKS